MANKEECDRYASELVQRFEELTRWAIENWPRKDFPLLSSDFSGSRREIGAIIGPRLGDGDDSDNGNKGARPYVDVKPMPWP